MFKPPQGDVYVLLYVDHHDSAYRWAENAQARNQSGYRRDADSVVVWKRLPQTDRSAEAPSQRERYVAGDKRPVPAALRALSDQEL